MLSEGGYGLYAWICTENPRKGCLPLGRGLSKGDGIHAPRRRFPGQGAAPALGGSLSQAKTFCPLPSLRGPWTLLPARPPPPLTGRLGPAPRLVPATSTARALRVADGTGVGHAVTGTRTRGLNGSGRSEARRPAECAGAGSEPRRPRPFFRGLRVRRAAPAH